MRKPAAWGSNAARRVGRPFLRYFERRFADVHAHLENDRGALVDATNDAVRSAEHELHAALDASYGSRLDRVEQQLAAIASEVHVSTEVAGELSRLNSRAMARLEAHVDGLCDEIRGALEQLVLEHGSVAADRAIEGLIGTKVSDIGPGTARYLNWLETLDGYKAQVGMLVTPQIATAYGAGTVEIAWVTERVLECAYLFEALATLPPGSRILDFGASYSANALALASLGHEVTALDVNGYPFEHPNLTVVAAAGGSWPGPTEPFDAIVCVSALEHVGLGHYGDPLGPPDADIEMMARLRSWIADNGTLVLTVPYGPASVDDVQRVYDDAGLERLLADWSVKDERRFVQHDRRTWQPVDGPVDTRTWRDSDWGVALITASAC